MLDFNEQTVEPSVTQNRALTDDILILYRTQECLALVQEALRCEGLSCPDGETYGSHDLFDKVSHTKARMILLEADDDFFASSKSASVESLRRVIPRHCQIILLGHDDSILTERNLRQQGFHYLLWPASRLDVVEQLRACQSSRADAGAIHAAMRVAVMAGKGGSGCTLMAAELSRHLVQETRQPTILVDHGYAGSNMHVMLGRAELARVERHQALAGGQPPDFIQASSLLVNLDQQLDYLACASGPYTAEVLGALERDYSFYVEDISTGINSFDSSRLAHLDVLVVMVHPSLSGLHQTRLLLESIACCEPAISRNLRVLLVLNHSFSSGALSSDLIEKYLDRAIDFELPWYPRCEDTLVTGKSLLETRPEFGFPVRNLIRQILGKPHYLPTLWQRTLGRLAG